MFPDKISQHRMSFSGKKIVSWEAEWLIMQKKCKETVSFAWAICKLKVKYIHSVINISIVVMNIGKWLAKTHKRRWW